MVEIHCQDGILREDTPEQAAIRKTKPWAQAHPERFQFNGLPYLRGRRRRDVSPAQTRDALLDAARRVGRRRLRELRYTVQARAPFRPKPAAGHGIAQLEFLHCEAERTAAQHCLDMIEWMRAASPDLDEELVAYMLELDRNEPQVFAGLVGKHMSMKETREETRDKNSLSAAIENASSIEDLLAVYQRFGITPSDRLLAMAAQQAAASESAQKKATQ